MKTLVKKSIGASILIALGDFVLLKIGNPLGPFLFSLGLLGVCYMGQNLFTGKCGFLEEDKVRLWEILAILGVNLVAGYVVGLCMGVADPSIKEVAVGKVEGWELGFEFFLRAVFCGMVMFIAVRMFRVGTPLGIIFGVPLFIFCGFQHCIANVVTMGVAMAFDWSIIVAVVGNFAGSAIMAWLGGNKILYSRSDSKRL